MSLFKLEVDKIIVDERQKFIDSMSPRALFKARDALTEVDQRFPDEIVGECTVYYLLDVIKEKIKAL